MAACCLPVSSELRHSFLEGRGGIQRQMNIVQAVLPAEKSQDSQAAERNWLCGELRLQLSWVLTLVGFSVMQLFLNYPHLVSTLTRAPVSTLTRAPVSTLTHAPVSTLTHVPPWSTNKLMLHQAQCGCNCSFTWLLVSYLEWTDICLCFLKKIYVTGILKRYLQSHIHCIINYDIQKPKQCSMATWIKKYAIFMHGGLLSSLRRHCHLQQYGWSWRTLWCVN